ncbi:MAG TPA: TonB-dependent receptor plug domain-containing protein, partial [Candidatus Eremiobacteraceae bacterium]|nr:TonB-dependent receptor plug domain-containing protein [Candidatus Eremiobacteraceae bacterium]
MSKPLAAFIISAFFAASAPALAADASAPASVAPTHSVSGAVVDSTSGLPLANVKLVTSGPTAASTVTGLNGRFTFASLAPGEYSIIATRIGYETTASEIFIVDGSALLGLTLAINRTQGGNSDARILGVTTVRASQSLQKAATISRVVSAQSIQQQGFYRAADYLQQLPGLQGGNVAQPGDDVSLNIRGIGTLETLTLIDGHPIGPRGDYNYELSPTFGLRAINVFYGSGGSDLYGVNAIGGVVNMETLAPTRTAETSFSQSLGSFRKLASSLQGTGSFGSDGKVGYAFAYGTQGLDGPFKHDVFYQNSAAYDQYATDPTVRQTGIYQDDTSFINKSGLAKMVWNLSPTSHLTAAYLGSTEWDDKTGNGDNDYVPYQVDLAAGQANLAAAIAANQQQAGSDQCNATNPATFTVQTSNSGNSPGFGPSNQPDGGSACQTPASFAQANFGYQGAGPAWQSYHSNDYHLQLETKAGNGDVVVDGFSNFYHHTYDRTHQLPHRCDAPAPDPFTPCAGSPFTTTPSWNTANDTNTGLTLSDDFAGERNDFGAGLFYENTAAEYIQYSPGPAPVAPLTHDTAFFLRDAYHKPDSMLTTYVNAWFKHSTITNTSYVDPRIAFVWASTNDVWRVATGGTSTQPTPAQLDQPFSPGALGAFSGGGVSCSSLNSVGTVPSTALRPERASDMELSYGHRFNQDSSAQISLYNTNVFSQIYGVTVPLSSVPTPGFDPTPYAQVVSGLCPGVSPQQALALLGLTGNVNIGHTLARGIELTGRQK